MEKGNVTVYEYFHKEAPKSVEEHVLDFGLDEDEEVTDESKADEVKVSLPACS